MNNKIVNVCVAFSDVDGNYVYSAATTVLSIVLHSNNNIKIHILSDKTLTYDGKILLAAIAHSKEIEIKFHEINNNIFKQAMMPEQYKFGLGSFYRFFIPEIIESGIAIYFDCDILCLADVNTLSDQAYEDESYYACVVQDSYVELSHCSKTTLRQRGFNHKKYFNSGVLVLNCEKINNLFENFSRTLIKVCYDYRHSPFIDQDALNVVFKNLKIKWMDVDYNYMMNLVSRFMQDEQQLDKKVLHFAAIKPWMAPELPSSSIYAKHYRTVMHIKQKIGL